MFAVQILHIIFVAFYLFSGIYAMERDALIMNHNALIIKCPECTEIFFNATRTGVITPYLLHRAQTHVPEMSTEKAEMRDYIDLNYYRSDDYYVVTCGLGGCKVEQKAKKLSDVTFQLFRHRMTTRLHAVHYKQASGLIMTFSQYQKRHRFSLKRETTAAYYPKDAQKDYPVERAYDLRSRPQKKIKPIASSPREPLELDPESEAYIRELLRFPEGDNEFSHNQNDD